MSLNFNKLEKVRECADGKLARCPACAEAGQDRKGEHLRIYPDGKFGCCVHPGDREHRKRIYALAGERSRPRGISVRVASAPTGVVQKGILGRLGRVFSTPEKSDGSDGLIEVQSSDASDGSNEMKSADGPDGVNEIQSRTARTGVCESRQASTAVEQSPTDDSRTARTPSSLLTYVRENTLVHEKEERYVQEFEEGVRSVRVLADGHKEGEEATNPPKEQSLPHFTPGGTLVIPFDSPQKFHWWKRGGQSVSETRAQVEKGEIYADDF